ncbi:MAG: tetratricopeptide repeat protein [Alphaproteobacteria bacterium]|nr:tetratricopeptide repeat protein [Alphaproteobacteria bacterium]
MTATVFRAAALGVVLALAAAPAARAQERGESPGAELSIRLQILEDELRQLRGELEVQRFRTRELQRQLNDVREAQGLEPVSPAAPAAPGGAGDPARGGDGTAGSDAAAGTLGGGPASAETVLDTPTLEGEPTRREEAPADGTYDRGLALLQAGRYSDARAELEGFVAANPEDPRAPEAAFWAAETLFVEGEYAAAAAAFAENYRGFGPDAPRAPDSLLKVALALTEMGDTNRACRTLEALRLRHDDLSRSLEAAADRARDRAGCG